MWSWCVRGLRLLSLVPAGLAISALADLPRYAQQSAGLGAGVAWPSLQIGFVVCVVALLGAGVAAARAPVHAWRSPLGLALLANGLPLLVRVWSAASGPPELWMLDDARWWLVHALSGWALALAAAVTGHRRRVVPAQIGLGR